MTPASLRSRPRFTELLAALVLLIVVVALLYGHTLGAYWRSDDGAHLKFAVDHSPWQYFFDPVVTRGQSGAHVTPWNVFFYDLNLALFGFEPRLHYAHLLALLVAGAWMLYVVLRLWVPARAALLGAAAFLLGKPLVYVGQELMAAHYATGLVFALLAVWCWVRGLERERWTLLIAGAVFYLLATTCKEVYVPLVALLPLIPVSSFRRRLAALWPFVVVALVYVAWRHAVLGQLLGGYSHDVTAWDPSARRTGRQSKGSDD